MNPASCDSRRVARGGVALQLNEEYYMGMVSTSAWSTSRRSRDPLVQVGERDILKHLGHESLGGARYGHYAGRGARQDEKRGKWGMREISEGDPGGSPGRHDECCVEMAKPKIKGAPRACIRPIRAIAARCVGGCGAIDFTGCVQPVGTCSCSRTNVVCQRGGSSSSYV